MPPVKKPKRRLRRHYLKEWREYRNLTQEQVAGRLDIDRSTLSRVENMRIPYSQELIEAAAEAYGCEPWDILNVNPLVERDVIDLTRLLRDASPEDRAAIEGYVKGRLDRAG